MKKILLYNLLVIFVLFIICEIISYFYLRADSYEYMKGYNEGAKKEGRALLTMRYAPVRVFNKNNIKQMMHNINYGNPDKKSLLFFGCSYMWGSGVDENETISAEVNKLTNRTTVNRAVPGGSILNMLQDLSDSEFYSDIKDIPQVEYVFYLFISDHLNRISNPYRGSVTPSGEDVHYEVNPEFKEIEGEIQEINPSPFKLFLYSFYTTKAWYYFYAQSFLSETKDDKMFKLFADAKKTTDEKFPGSKFVIIQYKDGGHHLMNEDLVKKLTDNGFIILDSEELASHELESEKWRGPDKEHPNAAAFKDVAAGLVKALKL